MIQKPHQGSYEDMPRDETESSSESLQDEETLETEIVTEQEVNQSLQAKTSQGQSTELSQ